MKIKNKSGKIYEYDKRILHINNEDLQYIKDLKLDLKCITNEKIGNDNVFDNLINNYYNNTFNINIEKVENNKHTTINLETYLKLKKIQDVLLEKNGYQSYITFSSIVNLLVKYHRTKRAIKNIGEALSF